MTLAPEEAVIGPALLTVNDVAIGLTTEDGIALAPEFEMVFLRGAQSLVTSRGHRAGVDLGLSLTFHQLTLAKWKLMWDTKSAISSSTLTLDFDPKPTELPLVLTMPGANGSTRVMTVTGVLETAGELVFANNAYTGAPITFRLIGDAATNSYGTIVETASSDTVPAVSSYSKIVSGTETSLADTDTGVAVAAKIGVVFNVAVRPDQLTSAKFMLKANDGNSMIACTVAYGTTTGATDYTKVWLTPASSLSSSTSYELIVAPGIRSFDGLVSAAGAAIQFTTA